MPSWRCRQGGYLVVSDADENLLHVYDLVSQDHLGAFRVGAGASIGAVDETEGLAATGMALSGRFGNGLLVLTDDDNGSENTNYKILSFSDVMTALDLPGAAAPDPGTSIAPPTPVVRPGIETDPVASHGDAADDPRHLGSPRTPRTQRRDRFRQAARHQCL